MTLSVPIPRAIPDPPTGPAELERPVKIAMKAVRYPDGAEVPADDVQKLGAFVYRSAGAGDEVWNDAEQRWQPGPAADTDLAKLTPLALSIKAGDPEPWQGLLVAAGQKDKTGADRYAKAVSGAPLYRLRGFAQARRGSTVYTGFSAFSSDITFVSGMENQRFGISFDTANARDAHRVRLALKNDALAQAGYLEIRASGGQEVEIANCDAAGGVVARVVLLANGDIRVEPRAGQSIVLKGTLEAEEIHYRPRNQTVKQYL
jgi:hypothetical protein